MERTSCLCPFFAMHNHLHPLRFHVRLRLAWKNFNCLNLFPLKVTIFSLSPPSIYNCKFPAQLWTRVYSSSKCTPHPSLAATADILMAIFFFFFHRVRFKVCRHLIFTPKISNRRNREKSENIKRLKTFEPETREGIVCRVHVVEGYLFIQQLNNAEQ